MWAGGEGRGGILPANSLFDSHVGTDSDNNGEGINTARGAEESRTDWAWCPGAPCRSCGCIWARGKSVEGCPWVWALGNDCQTLRFQLLQPASSHLGKNNRIAPPSERKRCESYTWKPSTYSIHSSWMNSVKQVSTASVSVWYYVSPIDRISAPCLYHKHIGKNN